MADAKDLFGEWKVLVSEGGYGLQQLRGAATLAEQPTYHPNGRTSSMYGRFVCHSVHASVARACCT